MKNRIIKTFIIIIIFLLFGTLLFFVGYNKGVKSFSPNSNFDTLYVQNDTVKIRDTILKPVPFAVIDTIPIPQFVDTNAIIRDYYKERQYLFTYPFGTVSFNVYNNSLFDYAANFNVINKTIYLRPKYIYGIGGSFGTIYSKPLIEIDGVFVYKNNMFNLGISYPFGIRIGYIYTFYKF